MIPIIKEGSHLLVRLGPKQYQKGDIVVFLKEGQLAAHRIIKTKNSSLILKGDNNSDVDGFFEAKQLLGKVEKIIYPEYTIDLNNRKNQFLKHFFALYSRLNLKFPFLFKIRKLYKIPFLKKLYRFSIKS